MADWFTREMVEAAAWAAHRVWCDDCVRNHPYFDAPFPADRAEVLVRLSAIGPLIAQRDREVQAQALRDAADEFRLGQVSGMFADRAGYTKAWLRKRAAETEGGE